MSATAVSRFIESRCEQIFPKLTAAQIAHVEGYGTKRANEVLSEPGDRNREFLVVLSGSIEIVQLGPSGETLLTVHLVKSGEAPGGIGEPGTSCVMPAWTNAIFAATNRRIRKLPVGEQARNA